MAVAVIVALAIPLTGCILTQRRDLEENIRRAEDEMKRLKYVLARDAQLRAEGARLRSAIESAAAQRAVEPGLPPTSILDVAPESLRRWTGPSPKTIRELTEHLELLNNEISKGIKLEKRLPDLEREIAGLQARLVVIEALPVKAAPAP